MASLACCRRWSFCCMLVAFGCSQVLAQSTGNVDVIQAASIALMTTATPLVAEENRYPRGYFDMESHNDDSFTIRMDEKLNDELNAIRGDQTPLIEETIRQAQPDVMKRLPIRLLLTRLSIFTAIVSYLLIEKTVVPPAFKINAAEISRPSGDKSNAAMPTVAHITIIDTGVVETIPLAPLMSNTASTSTCTTLVPAPRPYCRDNPPPEYRCTQGPKSGCPAGAIYTPYIGVPLIGDPTLTVSSMQSAITSKLESLKKVPGLDESVAALKSLPSLTTCALTSSQGVCNGQAVCACLNVNAPFTIPRTKDGSVDCKFDSLPTSTACPGNEKPQSSNDAASSDVEPGPNPFPVQSCSVQNPRSAVYVCSCRSRFLGALPMFSILTPGQACGTTAAPESCISPSIKPWKTLKDNEDGPLKASSGCVCATKFGDDFPTAPLTTGAMTIAGVDGPCNAKASSEASAKYKVRTLQDNRKTAAVYCVNDGKMNSEATGKGRACHGRKEGCKGFNKEKGMDGQNC